MAEEKRNLCAQIPISLHSRVRQEQEASGQTLSEYMTQLITEFFQMKEGNQNMKRSSKPISSGTTSNKRNSSWAVSRVPWRRSETQMRRPAPNRNRRRRIKRNNSTKMRRRSSGGVCFFR